MAASISELTLAGLVGIAKLAFVGWCCPILTDTLCKFSFPNSSHVKKESKMSYSGLVGGWREASWSLGAITKIFS